MDPLDEFPIHQAPLSMAHVVSSDRNSYDRYYFMGHDRTGDVELITGFGMYPNLGVMDAFVSVRRGTRQATLRLSDALGGDRLHPSVGPYRIEVIEPLRVVRIVCDASDQGLSLDVTWTGSFPVLEEPPHVMRQAGKVMLDACRFAQVGTWAGSITLDGEVIAVTPDTWVGSRDRSWGIRPVGEAEPAGRAAAEADPDFGFWWIYTPMCFDDFALILIGQEDAHGHRSLNEAVRVWPAESGRAPEQLGWPEYDVHYESGTRIPTGATIGLTERGGKPLTVEMEAKGYIALNCGPGYGGDPDWNHGTWKGRGWIDRSDCDVSDPAISGRAVFGVVDHVGRATLNGAEGWGLFEHGTFGRHDPSGFADFGSVAP